MIVISFFLLLEVFGVGIASRDTFAALADMHRTIRVTTEVRNLRQAITNRIQLVKESVKDKKISEQEISALKNADRQIDKMLVICSKMSAPLTSEADGFLEEAKQILAEEKSIRQMMLLDLSNYQPHLIEQLSSKAQDSLGKIQLLLSVQSDTLFDRIYKTRFLPLTVAAVLALFFMSFATFMAYRLRKQIITPIQNLIQSTQQLSDGDLKTRAKIYDVDEIGLLAQAFNKMASNLEQSTVSKSYIESILESMFNCVLVLDQKGVILTVNRLAVQTFGYTKSELIGLSITEILKADLLRLSSNSNLETEAYTRSGKKFPVLVSLASLDEPAKTPSNLKVCVIKDISESKRLESEIKERNQALSAANQELEAFSYSVSHDLRAPLRIIDGFSQALVEDVGDQLQGEAKNHLERIRSGVQRMGELIDAVLNLSRLTRVTMNFVTLDFSDMAKNIIAELSSIEPQRQVEVTIQNGMRAYGDKTLMKVTLENLIGNAWKYTSKKQLAKIEFGKNITNGQEIFYIKDNGAGFDMNYSKKLFTPFQRLHNQNEFSGTGIGLASAKRIIHRHSGKIWVESKIDEETTFFFTMGVVAKF